MSIDEIDVTDHEEEITQTRLQSGTDQLYPYGYSGNKKTKEEYLLWSSFRKIDPELARRIMRMMECAAQVGKPLGVGGSWRSSDGQEKLFRSRYYASPKGRTYWKAPDGSGPWWQKRAGVAAAAAPGKSFHEASTDDGKCLACDMVGDMVWMDANLDRFGMYNFASELWHVQPRELPSGRTPYRIYPSPPVILLPAVPQSQKPIVSAAKPTLKLNDRGNGVNMLQCQINFWQWGPVVADGQFGPKTESAVKVMQKALKQLDDGVYGPKTYAAYLSFVESMMTQDPTK